MPATTNGDSPLQHLSYPPGVHVPSLTWFGDDARQTINWDVQERHFRFLIENGVHGIVIAGTNGEAATLSAAEKAQLVQLARTTAVKCNRPSIPITLGGVAGCTHEAIQQTVDAEAAGADYFLALIPSYFHFAIDQAAIIGFFEELADGSPIPILIYNFPGVVAGLDVNSEILNALGKHKNIVGVKLTCGGIAKVARISASFPQTTFCALAGQSDWLIPALSVGGTGCITGVANLFPKTCVEMYQLYVEGKTAEASELQIKLSVAEWGFAKGGINGTKWVVGHKLGYDETSSHCRRPYPQFVDAEKKEWISQQVSCLDEIEVSLPVPATKKHF